MYCYYCHKPISKTETFETYKQGYDDFLKVCPTCAKMHKFTYLLTPIGFNVVNSTEPTYWSGEEKLNAHSDVPVRTGANLTDYDKAQLLHWHVHNYPKLHQKKGKKHWIAMLNRLDAAGFIDEHGITKTGEAYAEEHQDEIDLTLLD